MAVQKGRKSAAPELAGLTEQLCEQFLQTYLAAAGDHRDEQLIRTRVPVYELVSLLRLALHSWQKLKGSRLEFVIAILEERAACLPQLS